MNLTAFHELVSPVSEYLEFFLVVAAAVSAIYGFIRFSNKQLEEKIREMTKQIQPDANGGKSLADLHAKFDALFNRVDLIEARQIRAEEVRHKIIEATQRQTEEWKRAMLKQGIDTPDKVDYLSMEKD